MWGVQGWVLSYARPPVLGACGRGPLPTGCGCGGFGHGDPSPTPQRALLRAGFARCGGSTRAPGGGAPLVWVWDVRGWALSYGRLPVLGSQGRGPLPTGFWCGVCGRWDPSPTPRRALLRAGFARCGGGRRAPWGGRLLSSCRVSGFPALSHAKSPVLGECGRGPLPTGCGCGGGWAWGRVTNPTARALASCLCLLRGGTRAPGGGASCLGVRLPGLGALLRPVARPWGSRPGPATHWLWVRAVWAWGPITYPTARALASRLCVLWGRHEGARGGGGSSLGVGRPGLGALPRPTARLWGMRPGPATHWLLVRGLRVWGPITDPTARAIASWLCELWRRYEGAPGGGGSCLGVGRPGLGSLPRPTASPFWHAARARHPLAVGAGDMGVWTRHKPHSVRSCELALRAVGAARGRLGGRGPVAWVWVVRGSSALSLPDRPSSGPAAGARARGPGLPWHLLPRRRLLCVVRASRVCGSRWPLLPGTCACALVVAGGVPVWRAWWPGVGAPHLVQSGRSWCSNQLSRRCGAFSHPGGCRPRLYWAAAQGTWKAAENWAHCACRWPLPMQGRWTCSASYPLRAR